MLAQQTDDRLCARCHRPALRLSRERRCDPCEELLADIERECETWNDIAVSPNEDAAWAESEAW